MGDSCYMELTCKRADKAIFEELGFTEQVDCPASYVDCVSMVEEQANYGHSDEMPTSLVYFGTAGAGDAYDAESFACDGETYLAMQTSDQDANGYIVFFDSDGNPGSEQLAEVKNFILHEKKVIGLLSAIPENQPIPPPESEVEEDSEGVELSIADYEDVQKALALIGNIARMTRDRECTACHKDGDEPNPECDDPTIPHEPWDMEGDDAVETLLGLIRQAREIRTS